MKIILIQSRVEETNTSRLCHLQWDEMKNHHSLKKRRQLSCQYFLFLVLDGFKVTEFFGILQLFSCASIPL